MEPNDNQAAPKSSRDLMDRYTASAGVLRQRLRHMAASRKAAADKLFRAAAILRRRFSLRAGKETL